jgi:hypothetical protein
MRSSNCPRLDPIEQCWALMHQHVPQSGLQNIPAIQESNSEIPETHDSQELEPHLRSNHRQLSASSTLGISGRRLARPRHRSKYLAFWPKRMLGHPVQASVVIAKYICKGARPKACRHVVVENGHSTRLPQSISVIRGRLAGDRRSVSIATTAAMVKERFCWRLQFGRHGYV